MTPDTSEKGLESLIVKGMTGLTGDGRTPAKAVRKPPTPYGGTGWLLGDPVDYDREYAVDLAHLTAFLRATQPELAKPLALDEDGPTRRKFLARLQGEVTKRGVIDVLRHGIKHGPHHIDLVYGTPTPGNTKAAERYAQNRFSVTRQLRYSRDETHLALDLGLFINGLPVFTFELKNSLTKQTVEDAVEQYKRDRDPREHSGDLRQFIAGGKKIIISTVQKFPFILDEIGSEHRGRRFAIIIDEAHSSQGGKTSAALSMALAEGGAAEEEESAEDRINRIMEARKMLPNASYFAFTATLKNKTLEIFGDPVPQRDGAVKHRPFHSYTMKQAIQEGFILDVLRHYTPVNSYYKLIKTVEADPEFDTKRAKKKLRRYVESHDHAIRLKAEIMVDHFHEQVMALNKLGGLARAMVVTNGIARAIQYFHAFRAYLAERKSPYQAIVAFSGEHDYGGPRSPRHRSTVFPPD